MNKKLYVEIVSIAVIAVLIASYLTISLAPNSISLEYIRGKVIAELFVSD